MAHQEILAELDQRRSRASQMGGEKKLSKRKSNGDLNAEERLEKLCETALERRATLHATG